MGTIMSKKNYSSCYFGDLALAVEEHHDRKSEKKLKQDARPHRPAGK